MFLLNLNVDRGRAITCRNSIVVVSLAEQDKDLDIFHGRNTRFHVPQGRNSAICCI